jgi:AcrR family transcriptional regulator
MAAPQKRPIAPSRKGRIPAGEMDARDARILDAATEVFLESGFDGAKMTVIAKKAGCSLETLYGVYPNKAKMFTALTTRKALGLFEAVGPLNAERDLREALIRFATEVLALMMKPETIELHQLVIGESRRFPELGENFWNEGPGRGLKILIEYFTAKKAEGTLSIKDPHQAAEVFVGLVLGGATMRSTLGIKTLTDTKKQQVAWAEYAIDLFVDLLGQEKVNSVSRKTLA